MLLGRKIIINRNLLDCLYLQIYKSFSHFCYCIPLDIRGCLLEKKMQMTSSRIWTRVTVFIAYGFISYANAPHWFLNLTCLDKSLRSRGLVWFSFFVLMVYQPLWVIYCQRHPCRYYWFHSWRNNRVFVQKWT